MTGGVRLPGKGGPPSEWGRIIYQFDVNIQLLDEYYTAPDL